MPDHRVQKTTFGLKAFKFLEGLKAGESINRETDEVSCINMGESSLPIAVSYNRLDRHRLEQPY